jgi:hypothetical protein
VGVCADAHDGIVRGEGEEGEEDAQSVTHRTVRFQDHP